MPCSHQTRKKMKVAAVNSSVLTSQCPVCKRYDCWNLQHRMFDTTDIDIAIKVAEGTLRKTLSRLNNLSRERAKMLRARDKAIAEGRVFPIAGYEEKPDG